MRAWLKRWQEFTWWLPLLVVLGVVGWVLLGKFSDKNDLMRWLLELPVLTGYALAALGIAYLARRRQRRALTDEESADLWRRLLDGERGAIVVYLTDVAVWALTFGLALLFFWPKR